MGMADCIIKDHIFLDASVEPVYGSGQMDVDYPVRFATVTFRLLDTVLLVQLADRIRTGEGFAPLYPMDEYTEETCDNDGWYEFTYGISDIGGGRADSCIEFVPVNCWSGDCEKTYSIDLSEEEQGAMFQKMDEQCRKYLGRGCLELLAEARKEMEEEAELESNQA